MPGAAVRKRRDDPTMRWIAKHDLFDAVARQCGVSSRAVRAWKRVPWMRVIDVERATGRPRHQIRPDLHPTN